MTETSHRGWLQSVFVFIFKTLTFIEIYNKSQFTICSSKHYFERKKLRCMCVHRISAL